MDERSLIDPVEIVGRARRQLINQVAHRRAARHFDDERQALATELDAAEQSRAAQLLKEWMNEARPTRDPSAGACTRTNRE